MTFASRSIRLNHQSGTISQAKEADIAAMVHIEELIYGVAPWNRAAFAADLKKSDRLYLVLKNANGMGTSWALSAVHLTGIVLMLISPTLACIRLFKDRDWEPTCCRRPGRLLWHKQCAR